MKKLKRYILGSLYAAAIITEFVISLFKVIIDAIGDHFSDLVDVIGDKYQKAK